MSAKPSSESMTATSFSKSGMMLLLQFEAAGPQEGTGIL